jgi:hypothetical protein
MTTRTLDELFPNGVTLVFPDTTKLNALISCLTNALESKMNVSETISYITTKICICVNSIKGQDDKDDLLDNIADWLEGLNFDDYAPPTKVKNPANPPPLSKESDRLFKVLEILQDEKFMVGMTTAYSTRRQV